MSSRRVTVRAPAKVNLHLGVGAPGPDGFHPLVTVFHAVELHDDLSAVAGDALELRPSADHVDLAGVPADQTNIAVRAVAALGEHVERPLTLDLRIDKGIPVAGGMAGGSADAAAALVAARAVHGLDLSDRTLRVVAARLGSDVPFALLGGTALGRGRGEVLTPVADSGPWWWVVAPAEGGLSTPEVYRHFDRLHHHPPVQPAEPVELLAALASGDPGRLAPTLHNDLQVPALDLRPDLVETIARGEAEGALRGIVSGSGPTCVFLCEDEAAAQATAVALRRTHGTALVARGPAPGTHLLEDHA